MSIPYTMPTLHNLRIPIIAVIALLMPPIAWAQQDIDAGTINHLADTISKALSADLTGIFGLSALGFVFMAMGAVVVGAGIVMMVRQQGKTVSALTTSLQIFASAKDQEASRHEKVVEAIERQTAVYREEGKASRDHQILVADTLSSFDTRMSNVSKHLETLTGRIGAMATQIEALQKLIQSHAGSDQNVIQRLDELCRMKDEILKAIAELKPPPMPPTEPDDASPTPPQATVKADALDSEHMLTLQQPDELGKTGTEG